MPTRPIRGGSICARRLNPDEGTFEYYVEAQDTEEGTGTWELRSKLLSHSFAAVMEADSQEVAASQRVIAAWARKRHRDDAQGENLPLCHFCIPIRDNTVINRGGENDGADKTFFVGLGEWPLPGHSPNPTKKKKCHRLPKSKGPQEPALLLERQWSERHAVSLKHSCLKGALPTPAAQHFELGRATDTCRDASSIEIHCIVPAISMLGMANAANAKSGESPVRGGMGANGGPAARKSASGCKPPGSRSAGERLIVRYFIPDGSENKSGNASSDTKVRIGGRGLYNMPLSLFRQHYPQLLLDFLLQHSVVMESP